MKKDREPRYPRFVDKSKLPLSEREIVFVDRYLTHFNRARAAREAGGSEHQMSSANMGNRLYNLPRVRAEIDRRLAEVNLSSPEVLARLSRQAGATVEHFITDEGEVDLTSEAAKDNLDLLKKVKVKKRFYGKDDNETTEIETDIEIVDSFRALHAIGQHYGLFVDKSADGAMLFQQNMAIFFQAIKEHSNSSEVKVIDGNE